MSSLNMLSFGLKISAQDDTRSGLRASLASIGSFAKGVVKPITIPIRLGRAGLGLARDIQLGLRPLISGLDNLIDRGSGLEVIRQGFAKLTGSGDGTAKSLARSLVEAANGTIRLSEGMQLANRALASGLSFEQLKVALDFISKKSVATGKNASEALGTVITALSRSSTLVLDDFGILVDGLEGVRRSFDEIKGAGAFDTLGPAAQKAEVIRQAIAEMQGQMGKLGISGKELFFDWQRIKNSVGDAADGIFSAVGRSQALRDALRTVSDISAGIAKHFEGGGSFKELLFGKGASGGIVGMLSAAIKDIGSTLAWGIAGTLLNAAADAVDALSFGFDYIKNELKGAFSIDGLSGMADALKVFVGGININGLSELSDNIKALINASKEVGKHIHTAIVDALAEFFAGNRLTSWMFSVVDSAGNVRRGALEKVGEVYDATRAAGVSGTLKAAASGMGSALLGFFRGLWEGAKVIITPKRVDESQSSLTMGGAGSPAVVLAQAITAVSMASTGANGPLGTLAEMLREAGMKAAAGADGFKLLREQVEKFIDSYGKSAPEDPVSTRVVKSDELPLSRRGREELKRELDKAERDVRERMRGNQFVRERARENAAEEIERLRSEKRIVSPGDRRRIFERELEKEKEESTKDLKNRIKELEAEIAKEEGVRARRRQRDFELRGGIREERAMMGGAAAASGLSSGPLAQIGASIASLAASIHADLQSRNQVAAVMKSVASSWQSLANALGADAMEIAGAK